MSLDKHYILNPDHSLREVDLWTWAEMFEDTENRRVAETIIAPGIRVSTVFLGLDHNFSRKGPPIVFESMAFDDYGENACDRYATWDEAVRGHERMVAELKARMEGRVSADPR